MSDFDIIILFKQGFSINKIAKRYKYFEKLLYKKNISFYYAKRIVEYTLCYYADKYSLLKWA